MPQLHAIYIAAGHLQRNPIHLGIYFQPRHVYTPSCSLAKGGAVGVVKAAQLRGFTTPNFKCERGFGSHLCCCTLHVAVG